MVFVTFAEMVTESYTGIGESDWAFRTSFELDKNDFSASHADLVFDGLDTFAIVELVSAFGQSNKLEANTLSRMDIKFSSTLSICVEMVFPWLKLRT